jgi:hypothetical protein
MTLRILPALTALTLAACGQPQQSAPNAEAPAEPGSVALGSTQNLPDWLLVARQRDCRGETPVEDRECIGEIHFNQRTITRDAQDSTADIWIQVRHGQPQLFEMESATTETSIRFEVERLHYRFTCPTPGSEQTPQFIVVERQIMGTGETVVARDEPRAIYREPRQGSVTAIIQPIACRGS